VASHPYLICGYFYSVYELSTQTGRHTSSTIVLIYEDLYKNASTCAEDDSDHFSGH